MDDRWDVFAPGALGPLSLTEVDYARGRRPGRTYFSSSFITQFGDDAGYPGRYVYRVFDDREVDDDPDDGEEEVVEISTSPGGRKQIRLHVTRAAGAVRKLRIQDVPLADETKLKNVLTLDREQTRALLEALRAVEVMPVTGEEAVRIDDDLLRDVLRDPNLVRRTYEANKSDLTELIANDKNARDIVALEHRRSVVQTMRTWLANDAEFDRVARQQGGPERSWQNLLEENPWVLGVGLASQLLINWDERRLEQVVAGASIAQVGKRVDGLMRTSGLIRSMVFAEIKHHQTSLLDDGGTPYRSGSWRPSRELSGAITQAQQTVARAVESIGSYLADHGPDGERLSTGTFLVRPRSYVIAGTHAQLLGTAGGPMTERVRSFELYRRNLYEPEIVTFDELVERASWHVELAAAEQSSTQ